MNNSNDNRSGIPYLDEVSLFEQLSMVDAVDVLEEAVRNDLPHSPKRQHLKADFGEMLLMPSWGKQGAGVKLVTIRPDNPERNLPFVQGVFVLFAAEDSRPVGLVDGAALTALRTAAISGLAVRHLARLDACVLMMIGAGRQAHAHLDAMLAVRSIESVLVVDPRNPDRVDTLIAKANAAGVEARSATAAEVGSVDLVCTCTTSSTPVLQGDLLPDGVHVTAMGAYRPDMRELDSSTLSRSSVYVEDRVAAMAEAGDLIQAVDDGGWSADDIAGDLTELVRGSACRQNDEELTVFKSVGVAWQDLVVAEAALRSIEKPGYVTR